MLVGNRNGSHDKLYAPAGKPTTCSSLQGDGGGVAVLCPHRHLWPDSSTCKHATGRRCNASGCNDSSCRMSAAEAVCDAAVLSTTGGSRQQW